MPKRRDPYIVLGIPHGADLADVKRAYRRLVLAFHPDQCDDAQAADRFREVQHAYDTLNEEEPDRTRVPVRRVSPEPQERVRPPESLTYSSWRHAVRFRPEPFASPKVEQLTRQRRRAFTDVDDFFGGMIPEVFPRPATVEKDLYVEVVLDGQEARLGGKVTLNVPIQRECRACLGSGLGSLTRYCTYCEGNGCQVQQRQLELTVPPDVRDGEHAQTTLKVGSRHVTIHVLVRLAG